MAIKSEDQSHWRPDLVQDFLPVLLALSRWMLADADEKHGRRAFTNLCERNIRNVDYCEEDG